MKATEKLVRSKFEELGISATERAVKAMVELIEERRASKQPSAAVLEWFAKFRAVYPRPTGMSKAKEIWIAMAPSAMLAEIIISRVEVFKQTTWFGRTQDKIPHAITFLRQRRWEDEPEQVSTNGRRPADFRRETPRTNGALNASDDRFIRHIWQVMTALERVGLREILGKDRVPRVNDALRAISLDPADRPKAEEQLAKIEARLLERVIEGLGDDVLAACRAESAERVDTKMAERMTLEAWRAAKAKAFQLAVYERAGLPPAFG